MKKQTTTGILVFALGLLALTGCQNTPGSGPASNTQAETTAQAAATEAEAKETAPLDYPKYAITINGSTSGSTVDVNVRAFSQVLAKYLPVNLIVNSTASQVDSYRDTLNAKPDGYTMSITTANVTLCDVQGTTDFDTIEDAAFVGNIAKGGGYWVAVTKKFADSHDVHTFDELVAYTKEHPQELIIATSYGTINEIPVTSLIQDVGIDAAEVSIGAAGERTIAFIAGELDIFVGVWGSISQYVEAGEVVCLCSYGDERSPFTPDIPCTGELGYETAECSTFYTVTMPKDTPAEIVAYMESALEKAVNDPECVDTLAANSTVAYFMTGAETKEAMRTLRQTMIDMGLGE